jgi:hypothetical protein
MTKPQRTGSFWGFGIVLFLLAAITVSQSCKKEAALANGGDLKFSRDTLRFDTVFTALSSATLGLKIYNPHDQKVLLSSVRVGSGNTSFFKLNVDGRAGTTVSDLEIAARDSIYVFATVRIDPTAGNSPFIVEDQLIATLNGKDYSIPLIAYGQNAHYVVDSEITSSTSWETDKPYVIFGAAVVARGVTLTIKEGCRIYMHANARLFVDGTLKAIGTKKDSIIFQGDRLDRSYFGYEGYPGEWGGIYFTGKSTANELEHVIIKNCGNGAQGVYPAAIQVSPDLVHASTAQVSLKKVIIENSIGYGLLSFGGSVNAENCLIHSCGATALALVQGGKYRLEHCTIATYGNNKIAHTDNPVAIITNYFEKNKTETDTGALDAIIRNTVFAGSLTNELYADRLGSATTSLVLEYCVIKAEKSKIAPWVTATNNVRYTTDATPDALFADAQKFDFHPKASSILINTGGPSTVNSDLDDETRPGGTGAADIGCYELK